MCWIFTGIAWLGRRDGMDPAEMGRSLQAENDPIGVLISGAEYSTPVLPRGPWPRAFSRASAGATRLYTCVLRQLSGPL